MIIFLRNSFVLIAILLLHVFVAKAQEEYLVTVNPTTGVYTDIDSIPPVRWIALFNYSTIDENHHRFFFRGNYNGSADSLITVDETTGATLSEVYFGINNIVAFMYSNPTNILYGLQNNGGSAHASLVTIDPSTGMSTTVSNALGFSAIITDCSTIDNNTNSIIIATYDSLGHWSVFVIDEATGNTISQKELPTNIQLYGLQYDNVADKLYGMYYLSGQEYFCSVDINTGAVTTLSTIGSNTGFGIVGGSITFDDVDHRYIFAGSPGGSLNSYLYSIYAPTGQILSSPVVSETNGLTLPNVIQFRYDNTADTLYALHWQPYTPPCPVISISTINTTICPGTTYQLPSGIIINNAGTYYDTVKNSYGCDSIATTVSISMYSVITVTNIIDSFSQGQSYTLPSGTVVNTAGTYQSILRSTNGCDSIISTTLTVRSTSTVCPVISTSTINTIICSGNTYQLPSGTYLRNSGTYQDTIKNALGCDSIITTVNLSIYPILSSTNVTDSFNQGQSYKLPSGIIVNAPGVYQSTLTNINGCDSIINTNLVLRTITDSISQCTLNPPNAFTPNGDGYNDVWFVFQQGGCVQQVKVDVYNRWGSLVYHSDNYNNDWDGKYNGSPLPDATYYYVVSPIYSDGRHPVLKGSLTIFK